MVPVKMFFPIVSFFPIISKLADSTDNFLAFYI